jgi:hypothetical protein
MAGGASTIADHWQLFIIGPPQMQEMTVMQGAAGWVQRINGIAVPASP